MAAQPPARKNADIEALRTIAITFVMVQHVDFNLLFHPTSLQLFLDWGQLWPGVDLFFVISGFLVTGDLLRRFDAGPNHWAVRTVADFWVRRAWRLWPTAWLWLALITIGSVIWTDPPFLGPFEANLKGSLAGVFFYANYRTATISYEPYGTSFPYWSLSLEEQFYFLLPLVMLLSRRKLLPLALVAIAVQFPLRHGRIYENFRSDALLWGVVLAIWRRHVSYVRFEPKFLRYRLVAVLFVLTCLTTVFHLAGRGNTSPPYVIGTIAIVSALLVWAASYDRGYICPRFMRPVAVWIGSRSYALYVAHVPVFVCSAALAHNVFTPHDHLFSGAGNSYALAIAALLLVVAAETTHRFVEQPLRHLRLGRRPPEGVSSGL